MPRMLHRSSPSGDGQHLFIATPTYDTLSAGYTFALFHTASALKEADISYELALYSGDCHVDDARNRLVRDFLETDCTDLLFIDADLRWEAESVVKIMSYDRDVVAGTYPLKQDEEKYPCRFFEGEIWAEDDGLIEVESVPTGFLRIKRHVLETLAEKAVKFKPKSDNRSDFPLIFERQVHDGIRWGGDYTFCRKWRGEGGEIYVDPNMWFDHYGETIYSGRLASHLKRQAGQFLPGIDDVKNGKDSEAVYTELFNEWGNEWSASPHMLCALSSLVKTVSGQVLETGSGLSTLVMAAANPDVTITALESSSYWAAKVSNYAEKLGLTNVNVLVTSLEDGWYKECPDSHYSMVICDGPPRADSDRSKIYDYVGNALLIVDDMEDPVQKDLARKFAESRGREFHVLSKQRPFAVIPGE